MLSKDVPKRITFSKNAGLSSSSGVIPEIMSESQTTTGGGVDYGNGNGFNLTPAKDLSAGGGGGGEYVSDRNLSTTFVDNLTPTSIGNNAASPSKVDFTAHATSITRFDTAHMDFDQRLVNSIQNSSMSTEGYWSHENEALNPWTLMFRDRNVEKDYRQHFSNDYGQLDRDDMKIDEKWRVTTPKYSVFFGKVDRQRLTVVDHKKLSGVHFFETCQFYFIFRRSRRRRYLRNHRRRSFRRLRFRQLRMVNVFRA